MGGTGPRLERLLGGVRTDSGLYRDPHTPPAICQGMKVEMHLASVDHDVLHVWLHCFHELSISIS